MDVGKCISEGLMAFIPVYLELEGNCTVLYTLQGEEVYVNKSLRSVLTLISKYFLIDLKESRKYYGNLLNRKNLVPIPFNGKNIFIPLKTRKPLFKNDGATGYINISSIEEIKSVGGETLIYLINNYKVTCLSSKETVESRVQEGRLVKKIMRSNNKYSHTVKEVMPFYDEYDKPATKGDIALLRKEIINIRRVMD